MAGDSLVKIRVPYPASTNPNTEEPIILAENVSKNECFFSIWSCSSWARLILAGLIFKLCTIFNQKANVAAGHTSHTRIIIQRVLHVSNHGGTRLKIVH